MNPEAFSHQILINKEYMDEIGKVSLRPQLISDKDENTSIIWDRIHFAFYPEKVRIGNKLMKALTVGNRNFNEDVVLYTQSLMRMQSVFKETDYSEYIKLIIQECIKTDSWCHMHFENISIDVKDSSSGTNKIHLFYRYEDKTTLEHKNISISFSSSNTESIFKIIFKFLECENVQDIQKVINLKNKMSILNLL